MESSGENSVNTANMSTGAVSVTSSNEENHIPAATKPEIPEEFGQSNHKRVLRQLTDVLNGCLCRLVLNGSFGAILKCKQAGCETQWVSTLY
jgi:UDP-N-acetylglucosamine pyrophosphorylase